MYTAECQAECFTLLSSYFSHNRFHARSHPGTNFYIMSFLPHILLYQKRCLTLPKYQGVRPAKNIIARFERKRLLCCKIFYSKRPVCRLSGRDDALRRVLDERERLKFEVMNVFRRFVGHRVVALLQEQKREIRSLMNLLRWKLITHRRQSSA